ncbi:MAG: CIA30 family protein [Gammaproteobacteria bacterium]|nr:CIA30 family protein [Gammaproteobacteria bacterium]
MAQDDMLLIDDRTSGDYLASSGGEWRLITDGVMGGISDGRLSIDVVDNQGCVRLKGDVKLDNNGGFVQVALDLPKEAVQDIQSYTGLTVEVHGNNEQYNIHLRTRDNSFPWQSYRAIFTAAPEWEKLYLPFTEFTPYRTSKPFDASRLKRIGIVAIGREFRADLCISTLGFYR